MRKQVDISKAVGKTIEKIDIYGYLCITYTDNTFSFLLPCQYSDEGLEIQSRAFDILDYGESLLHMDIYDEKEFHEAKTKNRELVEKQEKSEEYQEYLRLKEKYETRIK